MRNLFLKISLAVLILVLSFSCKNDSKIVSSFGHMNEKLEESTTVIMVRNGVFKKQLLRKLEEDSLKYTPIIDRLEKAQNISNEFYYYLESVKDSIYEGSLDTDQARSSFSDLIDSDYLDTRFFSGSSLTTHGEEFLNKINEYKAGYEKSLGKGFGTISAMVSTRFRTEELVDNRGDIIPWLNFKFESFPAIASIFNITEMQSDVRQIETELILSMISGEFKNEFAMRNYTGIVRLDKGSYFPDERVTGKIVLGRFDESAHPFNIVMNGHQLNKKYGVDGGVLVDFNAPQPGAHKLNGSFTVMYDGTPVVIDYHSSYNVISRANVIEKIVYKKEFVDKIVYIDRPVASKPKKKVSKPVKVAPDAKTRKYYSSDKKVSSKIEGTINSEKGRITMLKTTLRQAKIGSIRTLDNKTFDVTSFMIKVPGQLTVYVDGNELSAEAIRTIDKAKEGQEITFFQIKAVDESGQRTGRVKEVKVKVSK